MKEEIVMKISAVFCFIPTLLFSQIDSTKLEFYPLHIGDTWQYMDNTRFYFTHKIIGDTTINGVKYFLKANPDFPQGAGGFRVDDLYRVKVLQSDGTEREFKYHLNESIGSYYTSENWAGVIWSNPRYVMKYVSLVPGALGQGKDAMIFNNEAIDTVSGQMSSYGFRFILVRGLGVYREEYEADRYIQLTGAVINGVQWGTIVSVEENPKEVPTSFVLKQNYPNPFNPSTIIEFKIHKEEQIKLGVYNLLGQEVRTLMEDKIHPGSYSVRFDASGLSSGTYIYRLVSGEAVQTRTMLLVK